MCASGVQHAALQILVVDDDPDVRLLLGMFLRHDGDFGAVVEAGSGIEAIEHLKAGCPDAVILDMRMPDLDGLQTARQLKRICPEAKIVLYSAFLSEDVFTTAADSGIDLCLSKTTLPHDVADMVRRLCAA